MKIKPVNSSPNDLLPLDMITWLCAYNQANHAGHVKWIREVYGEDALRKYHTLAKYYNSHN